LIPFKDPGRSILVSNIDVIDCDFTYASKFGLGYPFPVDYLLGDFHLFDLLL
jgi:hypothetical protein